MGKLLDPLLTNFSWQHKSRPSVQSKFLHIEDRSM